MKKLLLLSGLMVSLCTIGKAQNTITNHSNCPKDVEQVCYDAVCTQTYSSGFLSVAAGGGSIAVPGTCAPGEETYFNINVTSPYCIFGASVTIAGDNMGSANCGTFIQNGFTWPYCTDCFFTGQGNAVYDPTLNNLDFYP